MFYSQCPECSTVRVVDTEQIGRGNAVVDCESCREPYNLAWHLLDRLPTTGFPDSTPDDRLTTQAIASEVKQPPDIKPDWSLPGLDVRSKSRRKSRIDHNGQGSDDQKSDVVLAPELPVPSIPKAKTSTERETDTSKKPFAEPPGFNVVETEAANGSRANRELIASDTDSTAANASPLPLAADEPDTRSTTTVDDRNVVASVIRGQAHDEAKILAKDGDEPLVDELSVDKLTDDDSVDTDDFESSGSEVSEERIAARKERRRKRADAKREARKLEVTKERYWALGGIGMLILLGLQLRFSYLDSLSQTTFLRPVMPVFCAVFSCTTPLPRDIAKLEINNTEVSNHPDVPNALRISTTITNVADYSQAYPDVQLTLTDAKGKLISRRTFLPGQYVNNYIESEVHLISNETETFRFDISNPSKRAIGFEVELVK